VPYIKGMARCPTCDRKAKSRDENPAFPFCSPRCRAVDLGKWFLGAYRVPARSGPDSEPEQPASGPREEADEER
jgi:endogenous inhibitor of DNA gyrase (YacG/DUF329 family)